MKKKNIKLIPKKEAQKQEAPNSMLEYLDRKKLIEEMKTTEKNLHEIEGEWAETLDELKMYRDEYKDRLTQMKSIGVLLDDIQEIIGGE